jgi:peptide/nickel transport system permease protein
LFTVWGAVTIVFFASRLIPVDPARILAGSTADEASIESIRAEYGLDKPLYTQYFRYMGDLIRGDLGRSTSSGREVASELKARAPASIELILSAVLFSLIGSGVLSLASLKRPGKAIDRISNGIIFTGTALPPFLIGVLLLFLFYTLVHIAPPPLGRLAADIDFSQLTGLLVLDGLVKGRLDVLISAVSHLLLPTIAIGFSLFPQLLRVIKETGRRAIENPAARAAWMAGVRGIRYWVRYIFSLTAVPVLSLIAGSFGYLIGGVVVIEVIFSWNGLGTFVVNAVAVSDYNVIQGVVLIASAVYAIAYFISDVLSWLIDPRILEAAYA